MIAQQDSAGARVTVEAYLASEQAGDVKHEFVHGTVYAMSGGSVNHARLANTVRANLRAHLLHTPCDVLGPDVRLRIGAAVYYYPDAMVLCDAQLDGAAVEVDAPRLVVEVLSDGTEARDRGTKFAHYQTVPWLEEYVLVDSRRRAVECFRRSTNNMWSYRCCGNDDMLMLQTVELSVPLQELYAGTGL